MIHRRIGLASKGVLYSLVQRGARNGPRFRGTPASEEQIVKYFKEALALVAGLGCSSLLLLGQRGRSFLGVASYGIKLR